MYTSIQLLNMAKASLGGISDYALSKKLGVSTSFISKVKLGKSNFGPDTALQLAELLELDPLKCIGSVQFELAKKMNNENHANMWKQYA